MPTWKKLLPDTCCPTELDAKSAKEWVIKPVLGRVGVGVAMPGVTQDDAYKNTLAKARRDPTGWTAQGLFESVPVPTPHGLKHVCLGIFTVAGRAAGAYARMTAKPLTDGYAEEVAVLVRRWRRP